MGLKLTDLIALAKADEKARTISISSREVFQDPSSRERLIAEGLITEKGEVTDAGMSAIRSIRKKEEALKKGIPLSERNNRDAKRLCRESTEQWLFVMLGKDQIVTNGELLFVGKPEPAMRATRGDDDLRRKIPEVIKQCGKGGFKQLWPHSYQAFSLGGVDLVWMADETQGLMIPILAKYFDFIFGRFPKSTFWGSGYDVPVQAKVRSKGIKDSVVALIATFELAGQLEVPAKLERWRDEVPKQGMSPMGEDGGGSLREGAEE